jgi:GNAT superfamily N-acetyltransferase
MENKITIKPANEAQIESIIKLNTNLFIYLKQWSKNLDLEYCISKVCRESLLNSILDQKNCLFVATDNDSQTIIGFLAGSLSEKPFRIERHFSEIDRLYVSPEFRSKRVGKILVDAFIDWSNEKNVKVIRVQPTFANIGSRKFYNREGFAEYEVVLERPVL